MYFFFFFFNDTATTEIYTLPLHDALPIGGGPCPTSPSACAPATRRRPSGLSCSATRRASWSPPPSRCTCWSRAGGAARGCARSEEHTSELQSRQYLVCRLLLEKKKKKQHV